MLLLGHPGITLGSAVLISTVIRKRYSRAHGAPTGKTLRAGAPGALDSGLAALGRHVDLRLLLIGSFLPDLIDKPLGQVLLRDIYQNGRIFAHTLLFVLVLAACGLYLYRRHRGNGLLVLAAGSLAHIAEDEMWLNLPTLLWPLYGFAFPTVDLSRWVPGMVRALFTEPGVYVPEAIGGAVLAWFAWRLWRGKKYVAFISGGRL